MLPMQCCQMLLCHLGCIKIFFPKKIIFSTLFLSKSRISVLRKKSLKSTFLPLFLQPNTNRSESPVVSPTKAAADWLG